MNLQPIMKGPSTPHQRLFIRTLLRQVELPTDFITLSHLHLFRSAGGVPEPREGRGVDDVLTELTKTQASSLIQVLRSRAARYGGDA